MTRATCWAVVPAGGTGERFSADRSRDKLLEPIDGTPMLLMTIRALMAATRIEGVIISASAESLPAYRRLLEEDTAINKPFQFANGGATRRQSVLNALELLPLKAGLVAVHDAARPLIDPALIDKAVNFLEDDSALGVVIALPMHDTVKRVNEAGEISETLDRTALWRAQTPQVFWTEILLKAHRKASHDAPVTDDAQLMELMKLTPVKIIEGCPDNIKITVPEDLAFAENLLRAQKASVPS